MRNKKGFTLVELLAVIIILAVIVAIAVPTVSNVIKESRREAFKNSVHSYVRAAAMNKYYDDSIVTYQVVDGVSEPKATIKGDISEWNGSAQVYNTNVFKVLMTDGEFCATSDFETKDITVIDGNCDVSSFDPNEPAIILSAVDAEEETVKSGNWTNKDLTIKATIYLIADTSIESYQWYKEDSKISGATKDEIKLNVSEEASIEGDYKLSVKVGDKEYSSKGFNAKIDKIKPTCGDVIVTGEESNGWYISDVTLSSEQSIDNESGLKTTLLNYDKLTENTEGTEVKNECEDNAGNQGIAALTTVKIDKEKPTATVVAMKSTTATEVLSGSWSDETLKIEIIGESPSGIEKVLYCIDTENSCTPDNDYTGEFTHEVEGTRYIRYTVKNNVGKESEVGVYIAKIDAESPSVTIKATKVTSATEVASETWSDEKLKINITSTANSGISKVLYCIDTENSCKPDKEYAGEFVHEVEGTRFIRYLAVSNSGKSSTVASYTAKVDTVEPTMTITAKKSSAGTIVTSGTWSNETIKVTLTNTSAGFGTMYYCTNSSTCEPTSEYTGEITVSTQGTSYVRYKITNMAGRSSEVAIYTAKVDTVNPTTATVSAEASYSGSVATVTFTMNGADAVGIQKYILYYKKSSETTYTSKTITTTATEATTSITGASAAIYDYYVEVYDNAGNKKTSEVTTSGVTLKTYGASGANCGYTYGEYSGTTSTKQTSCTAVAATETGTTYTTCTLDSSWTETASSSVGTSNCTASETTTSKVTCSSTWYSCGSWTSSTATNQSSCTKGSAPACGSASQSYVYSCTLTGYAYSCTNGGGSGICTGSNCCTGRCGTSSSFTCSARYTKVTYSRSKTAYKTKKTYAKYYTKVVYTRTKTENSCWY